MPSRQLSHLPDGRPLALRPRLAARLPFTSRARRTCGFLPPAQPADKDDVSARVRQSNDWLGAFGDPQEGLVAALAPLGRALGLGVLLGLAQLALGVLQARAQVAGVELARVDGVLDQHERALGRDLEVALALGEADDVGVGLVEAQLRRVE